MGKVCLLISLSLFMLVGCSGGDGSGDSGITGPPGITGYVMDKKEKEILVVSTEAEDYSDNGGKEEFYDAVRVYNYPTDVQVGEQVKVWFEGGVQESYPAQASAENLEIVPSSTPEGADLSEAEALRLALTENEFGREVLTVGSVSYDTGEDRWTIELKGANRDREHQIQVEDE